MNTKTLSQHALSVIDQYLHFKAGTAVCSVPYFNNKVTVKRGALRAYGGKGSPQDIFVEVQEIAIKKRISLSVVVGSSTAFADESLKKVLVENNLGIDCSGFAYYILNAESQESGKGSLDRHLSFIKCVGMIAKIRCSLRPIENCDVATLANDTNSRVMSAKEIQPGDFISLLSTADAQAEKGHSQTAQRDHILVIHQVEYQNFIPTKIHYSHAIAYPEDGIYGSGIRQGLIEILDPEKDLLEQKWIEEGKEGSENRLFMRAKSSQTEVRRLKWM